jgi:hypothetical protein
MAHPCVTFALPDARLATAGAGATIGRSNRASIRIDGPGIAAFHARIAPDAAGLILEAMDGPVPPVALAPGAVLEIGAERLAVHALRDPPDLVFRSGWGRFSVGANGDGVLREITGLAGTIGSALLAARAPIQWEQLAEKLWPDDAAIRRTQDGWTDVDERRFRNRWDQQLATLRAFADDLRPGGLVRVVAGAVDLALRPGDVVRTT